jgi:hypothetical protein
MLPLMIFVGSDGPTYSATVVSFGAAISSGFVTRIAS